MNPDLKEIIEKILNYLPLLWFCGLSIRLVMEMIDMYKNLHRSIILVLCGGATAVVLVAALFPSDELTGLLSTVLFRLSVIAFILYYICQDQKG